MKNRYTHSLFSIIALSGGLLLSGMSQVTLASPQTVAPLTSLEIIENYRSLRSSCAKSQGVARRNCYSRLNEATADYQQAKERLTQTNPGGALLSSR